MVASRRNENMKKSGFEVTVILKRFYIEVQVRKLYSKECYKRSCTMHAIIRQARSSGPTYVHSTGREQQAIMYVQECMYSLANKPLT